ncbi:MAG: hypothetical protein Q9166_001775 [cf. Caloplaca sp. 2 TL-2023]
MRHERIDLPTTFSRKPNVGYQLPEQWFYRSCVLQLDMDDHDEEETASFRDISFAAVTVMLACVAQAPHLGGTQFVGPKSVMNAVQVAVAGKEGIVSAFRERAGLDGSVMFEKHRFVILGKSQGETLLDTLTEASYYRRPQGPDEAIKV